MCSPQDRRLWDSQWLYFSLQMYTPACTVNSESLKLGCNERVSEKREWSWLVDTGRSQRKGWGGSCETHWFPDRHPLPVAWETGGLFLEILPHSIGPGVLWPYMLEEPFRKIVWEKYAKTIKCFPFCGPGTLPSKHPSYGNNPKYRKSDVPEDGCLSIIYDHQKLQETHSSSNREVM